MYNYYYIEYTITYWEYMHSTQTVCPKEVYTHNRSYIVISDTKENAEEMLNTELLRIYHHNYAHVCVDITNIETCTQEEAKEKLIVSDFLPI